MKTIKKNFTTNKETPKNIDIQELQQAWEKTAQKLKNSSSQEDQILYNFLETNYVEPHTGLITSKKKKESHSISCKAKDFRRSNQIR